MISFHAYCIPVILFYAKGNNTLKTEEKHCITTENIYLRLEPKYESNMKNVREEELTCDPEGTIKLAIKIL